MRYLSDVSRALLDGSHVCWSCIFPQPQSRETQIFQPYPLQTHVAVFVNTTGCYVLMCDIEKELFYWFNDHFWI